MEDITTDLAQDLEDISTATAKEKLGIGAIKASLEYRKEQIKFSFGRPQREELMKDIRKKREKLDQLLEKSDKVARYQRPTTISVSRKSVKSFLHYWKHADRVHRLIRQSWGCNCQTKHCAHLWLQHQTSNTFEFKLLVFWSPVLAQNAPPWQPQGLCITYGEGTISQVRSQGAMAQPKPIAKPPAAGGLSNALTKGAKRQRLMRPSGVR
jgi:hypothetical protein